MMKEKIAVIIPAKGFLPRFEKCLTSVLELDYPDFEVIVVDDGIEEAALAVLHKFRDRVKIIESHGRGPSYARNLAVRETNANYLAFTDSDCIVDKNWLTELLKGFLAYPEAAACGGVQRLPQDAEKFEKRVFLCMKRVGFIAEYMRKGNRTKEIIEVNHNPSCNVMYKREAFLKMRGFLERLWPGEDVELDYRLKKEGFKIIFNPGAVVYHYPAANLRSFLKMMYRYGRAQGFLVRKYGVFRKIQVVPFLSVIFSIFLVFTFKTFGYLLLLGCVLLFCFAGLEMVGFVFWNLGFWKQFSGLGASK
jgi:GT2 family glycosyltransferase